VLADAVAEGLLARSAGAATGEEPEPMPDWERDLLAGAPAAVVAEPVIEEIAVVEPVSEAVAEEIAVEEGVTEVAPEPVVEEVVVEEAVAEPVVEEVVVEEAVAEPVAEVVAEKATPKPAKKTK